MRFIFRGEQIVVLLNSNDPALLIPILLAETASVVSLIGFISWPKQIGSGQGQVEFEISMEIAGSKNVPQSVLPSSKQLSERAALSICKADSYGLVMFMLLGHCLSFGRYSPQRGCSDSAVLLFARPAVSTPQVRKARKTIMRPKANPRR